MKYEMPDRVENESKKYFHYQFKLYKKKETFFDPI